MKVFLTSLFFLVLAACEAQQISPVVISEKPSSHAVYPISTQPYFWFDGTSTNYFASGDDNIGRIYNTGRGRESHIAISSYDGSRAAKPSFNGEGVYFNGVNAVKAGAAGNWNGFHNNNNFTIYFSWKQLTVSNTYLGFLLNTNNGTSTQIGFSIQVDNRSAQSRTDAIVVTITKGINGQAPISVVTNNAVVQNAYNWGKVTYDGTNVRVYTNGTLRSTTAPSFAMVTTNATNTLHIGATAALASGANIYLKHAMFFTSLLSGGDQTSLDTWIDDENDFVVTPTNGNVYILAGQSNAEGKGVNAAISSDLTNKVGAYIFKLYSTTPTSESHWGELQLSVNNEIASGTITEHGIEMRFVNDMNLTDIQNVFFIKYAIGGTALAVTADAAGDWNATSTNELYDKLRINVINTALREMEHVMRKIPVIRGFIWIQGEADSISGRGASYKANFTAMFNGVVDYINTTLSIATPKLRLFIFRTKNGGAGGFDPTDYANVVAAQTDIGSNYLTDNPSYSSKVLGTTSQTTDDLTLLDALHYNTSSINTMGVRAWTYYQPFQFE